MPSVVSFTHIALGVAGIIIALYSLYVERMMFEMPGYTPACDMSEWAMSCSKVFQSKYARPLSHWGIVPTGDALDLGLPVLALIYFVLVAPLPLLYARWRSYGRLVKYLSYASVGFNLYLAYILKFVLGEVCVVCLSNYFVNLGLWLTTNRIVKKGRHTKLA